LRVQAAIGYSFTVSAQDEDDHVLRYKLNKGDCDGTALLASLDARYQATEHWFASAGFDLVSIDTEGTQRQSFYDGPLRGQGSTIDLELKSSQKHFFVSGGYAF
jgi:hypothetical protein